MRARHDDGALVGLREDVADIEHVGGLEPEVELLDDRLGKELDQSRRVGERGNRDPPDEERGKEAHGGEVSSDELGDVGPLDLDNDALAGQEAGAMDLGDRGGGNRGPVEFRRKSRQGARRAPPRRYDARRRRTPEAHDHAEGGTARRSPQGRSHLPTRGSARA